MMNVITTALSDLPVNHRALCHASPSVAASARPLAQTSSFQNFFAGHAARVRRFKKLQIAVIKIVNNLTN